jgi:hypothetical protein
MMCEEGQLPSMKKEDIKLYEQTGHPRGMRVPMICSEGDLPSMMKKAIKGSRALGHTRRRERR